jgi:hypothetical protein
MTFNEIIEHCREMEKNNKDIFFKAVVTTSLGEHDHLLRVKEYEKTLATDTEKSKIVNIRCDFMAYTNKLGKDKYFSLNDGNFTEGNISVEVSIAGAIDIVLYVGYTVTELGRIYLMGGSHVKTIH